MTSHEYANRVKEIADFLLAKPEFEMQYGPHLYQFSCSKEIFLAAVKALGSVRKEYKGEEIRVNPVDFPELCFEIPRNRVCRLVREAEYDCEPLLSQAEEAQLTTL